MTRKKPPPSGGQIGVSPAFRDAVGRGVAELFDSYRQFDAELRVYYGWTSKFLKGRPRSLQFDLAERICVLLVLNPEDYDIVRQPGAADRTWQIPIELASQVPDPERRVLERVLGVLYKIG